MHTAPDRLTDMLTRLKLTAVRVILCATPI